jgi:ubiquinone/menaquinone biosynthesis C-methylase UbiE
MLTQTFARLGSLSPRLKRTLWRQWYQLLAARFQQTDWTFMNYGYVDLDARGPEIGLEPADEPDRCSIQLYHHVASAVDLRGLDVLDVGCGRGGGSAYIARYLEPASILGVDFSKKAVAFCKRTHSAPALRFQQGDAEALPCADARFDVVINVESSHCYGSVDAFFSEVFRVLKPGGYFLWADLRAQSLVEDICTQFEACGFAILRRRCITPNIVEALDRVNSGKMETIRRQVPKFLVNSFQDFAGVKGTRVYEALRAGKVEYLSCVLQKPHPVQPVAGSGQRGGGQCRRRTS